MCSIYKSGEGGCLKFSYLVIEDLEFDQDLIWVVDLDLVFEFIVGLVDLHLLVGR